MTPLLAARGLAKAYGEVQALQGVDLELQAGACLGVVGYNGAGKTTLLRILVGLLGRDAGTVTRDPAAGMTLVTERDPEYPTAWDADDARSYHEAWRGGRVALSSADANRLLPAQLATRRLGNLSTGERRRAELLRALESGADIVVLDEPTRGLDMTARPEVWAVLRRQIQAGRSVLLASHDLEEIEACCTGLLVLHEGAAVFRGAPAELSTPALRVQAEPDPDLVAGLRRLPGLAGLRVESASALVLPVSPGSDEEGLARALREALVEAGHGGPGVQRTSLLRYNLTRLMEGRGELVVGASGG